MTVRLRVNASAVVAVLLFAVGIALGRAWDLRTPAALFEDGFHVAQLSSGEVLYGRLVDRFSSQVRFERAHYLAQQDGGVVLRARASDLHAPPAMLIERDQIVWTERLAATSPFAQYLAGTGGTPAAQRPANSQAAPAAGGSR